MGYLEKIWKFLNIRKKYWLAPILLVFFMFSVLIASKPFLALVPFTY